MNAPFDAVIAVITDYFEGLYRSDTQILRRVFHPSALYACATDGTLLRLDMGEYFPIVDKRPSPASRNEARADRIVSLEFAGPVTALARVQCTIAPKHFTDLLTLVHVDGRWQIISKVFHYELAELAPHTESRHLRPVSAVLGAVKPLGFPVPHPLKPRPAQR